MLYLKIYVRVFVKRLFSFVLIVRKNRNARPNPDHRCKFNWLKATTWPGAITFSLAVWVAVGKAIQGFPLI